MLLSRELSYMKRSQEASEATWIYRLTNRLPTAVAMRLCKMARLPPAFPLQLFSNKCGFNFSRKADMKFLLRVQAQKTGWKKHPCCHRLMWTLVFPLTHGRGAFSLSLAIFASTALYDKQPSYSFGRTSLNPVSNESEVGFHLKKSRS